MSPDPLRRLADEAMDRLESACEVPEHAPEPPPKVITSDEGRRLIPRAHTVDVIVRKDGREYRFEGDFLKPMLREPARPEPAPEPLRRLAEEAMTRLGSACEVPEHHAPWCVCVQSCLESIFEGVVREAAQLAGEGGVAGALQRWGLSPESAPESRDGR